MIYLFLAQLFGFLLDICTYTRRSERHKDLQILVLRQMERSAVLRILQRHNAKPPPVSLFEKIALAVLAVLAIKLVRLVGGAHSYINQVALLFKPDTLLKWHRDLVRRKWTFKHKNKGGGVATTAELQTLVKRFAAENPSWGYSKIHGELLKLGHSIERSTVRDILKRLKVPPAPERNKGGDSWSNLLRHYGEQIIACDFLTVETAWLKTLYAFFFIELGTRRVHFAGCTAHPTADWVTQQARQLTWTLQDEHKHIRFLIRDRDAKFVPSFDHVFAAEGIKIVRTPFRTPVANTYAERWVRSVRSECLDRLLIINQQHLARVVQEYVRYYNNARPHQGIDQNCPIPITRVRQSGVLKRRDVLGGIIQDYYQDAA